MLRMLIKPPKTTYYLQGKKCTFPTMIYLINQPFAVKNKKIIGAKNKPASSPPPKEVERAAHPRNDPPTNPIQCRTNANLFAISISPTSLTYTKIIFIFTLFGL